MKPTIEEIRQYFLGIGSSQKTTEHVAIYSSLHLSTASTSQAPSQAPHKIVINSPKSSALPASFASKKIDQEAREGIELNSAPADKLLKEPETFDLIFTKNKVH